MSYRVGVLGATGAVGSTILEVLARARLPRRRGRPLRLRALGRSQARLPRRRDRMPAAVRGDDRRAGPRALLGRRRDQRRVGAALRRGRRGGRRQHELLAHARGRAAGSRRGQPRRGRRPQRPDREPELLDHAGGGRAGADPASGRHRADRRTRPTSRSPAPARAPRRVARAVAGGARGRAARGGGLSARDRLQRAAPGRVVRGRRRLHDRGAQDDGRDPQDPRRHGGGAGDLGDLRAGAGLRRPLGVGQHPDPRTALARAVPRAARPGRRAWWSSTRRGRACTRWRATWPVATRSWSAASAATPLTNAASTSGWSATTCARAPRPTRSRSPSCSPTAIWSGFPRAPPASPRSGL